MEAKCKHLRKRPHGTWDFSHWKRTRVSQHFRAGLGSFLLWHNIPASKDVNFNFGHVIAVDVFLETVGYIF